MLENLANDNHMKWCGKFIDKSEVKNSPHSKNTIFKWEFTYDRQYVIISVADNDFAKSIMHHSQFHRLVVDKIFIYK